MPIDVILYRLNSYYFWLFAVLYGLKVIVQLGSNLPRKINIDFECDFPYHHFSNIMGVLSSFRK